ncbi:MAG: class I SAM-dependent methyltransferase [Alphaproteobacteria bacterium]|nr:MAG: class I SAM-dependent methyltransferase [Alphaproteobacteria bacterium]
MKSPRKPRNTEHMIDPGQALRYSVETQDLAYRSGAYAFAESLDLAPRMATIASYITHLGRRRVLDIGCGTGELVRYLPPEVSYIGVDVAPSAIATARARYAERPQTQFHIGAFRDWTCPQTGLDALVWAGIGRAWTRDGRKGRFSDWLEILDRAEPWLAPDAVLILEMVAPHWDNLSPLIAGRYEYLAGCDLDCLKDDHRAVRSLRVFRRPARTGSES